MRAFLNAIFMNKPEWPILLAAALSLVAAVRDRRRRHRERVVSLLVAMSPLHPSPFPG